MPPVVGEIDPSNAMTQRTIAALRQPRASTLEGAGQGEATTLNLLRRNIREIPRGLLGLSPLDPTNPTEMYRIMSTPTPLIAGTFVGKRAATWNAQAAARATELEKQGVDARTIWNETGTWRGKDGQLRQEINDQPAKIQDRVVSDIQQQGAFIGPLNEALQHEELFRAYPRLAEVPTTMYAAPMRQGRFSQGTIEVGGPSTEQQKRIALHETQHAIQQLEGFARGGTPTMAFLNPEAFKILREKRKELTAPLSLQEYSRQAWGMETPNEEVKSAYKQYVQQVRRLTPEVDRLAQESAAREYYLRLGGEVEARAVEKRRNLTPKQRRATFPGGDFDIPQSELIIRTENPVFEEAATLLSRESIRTMANDLTDKLRQQGFNVELTHTGSRAGPSSYLKIYDPQTERFLDRDIRISGHSKGPKMAQFSYDIFDEEGVQRVLDIAAEMRAMGPSETMQKQQMLDRLVSEKISNGLTPKKAYKEAKEEISANFDKDVPIPK
jgi:hypothetical protein